MIARPIKTARSLQILHELGQILQILSHQRTGKELVGHYHVMFHVKNNRKGKWTEDLDARKMEAFQLNTIKSKKDKM